MSLFDLQDVCIAIGSLATLDLPMVVDLIGIYVLKGPYCTLTTTNWFLQALSVIPRGSWRDVARRFTMIRWASPKFLQKPKIDRPPLLTSRPPRAAHRPPRAALRRTCSGHREEVFPSVQNPSSLLVQIDGGRSIPIVDLIDDLPPPTVKSQFSCKCGWSQAPRRQQGLWDAITGGNSAREDVIAREAVIANSQVTAAQHMERERAYDIIASVLKIRFLDEEMTNRQYTHKMARVDAFPSQVKDRKETVIPWTEVFEKGMCLSLANMK
ncbi:actin-related protein 9 [Dorcoceras hygrometricum]|uniref:Actin-related protein 9 n=1 Tax=Dorcoceras hygrometricum TaxID=472368 RepID=A0A2Z7AFZ6_9LAMI|nr:actin-related protein 9 [Dorcoceras hygrometricum]